MTQPKVEHEGTNRDSQKIRMTGKIRGRGRGRIAHERRILLFAILSSAPALLIGLLLLWTGDFQLKSQWTITFLIGLCWWGFIYALQQEAAFPLRTLSNLLAAMREGDYSMRARGASYDDALGEVAMEVNELGQTLREERLGAMEATALLSKVMAEIDVAIFAFDEDRRLRLVNQRGEALLGRAARDLLGRTARALDLEACLEGKTPRLIEATFAGGLGRWEARRSTFREVGKRHQLLVLSDLTRTLRQEERQAWQRLIQVLRHEINNSLAPINSLAGSLTSILQRQPRPDDWEEDVQQGLQVIEDRSKSLGRFMESYSQLARLPDPSFRPVEVGAWIRRIVELQSRPEIQVALGPQITIEADGDQLDQLLINLIRNAVEAAEELGGGVEVGWRVEKGGRHLEIWVDDEGPGISNPENLFVPFFTTKPEGSGIGLVLSRQIAEAHGGSLFVSNRDEGQGCRAMLRLPLNSG